MIRRKSGRTLSSTKLVLKFVLSTPSKLKELLSNINGLLLIDALQNFEGDVIISLSGSNAIPHDIARITMQDLQQGLFLLLSNISEELPSKARHSLTWIWIDGSSTILRATYAATATSNRQSIPYRYADLAETNVCEQRYRKIINTDSALNLSVYGLSLRSLFMAWIMLRDTLWDDWRSRGEM
jgi:hypothetical protein